MAVTVSDTPTSVRILPTVASASAGGGYPFIASLADQFGDGINGASFTWSVLSGTGTINSSGDFTAPTGAETDVVQATSGGVSGTAVIYVIRVGSPTVATAASATPNPVTGMTTTLSVLGADASGESTLTYTWQVANNNPALVTFSDNADNTAKTTTAAFTQAGTYVLTVTITNSLGLSTTSSVTVTVSQTPTSLTLFPALAALNVSQTLTFYPTLWDQFGNPIGGASFTWAVTGGVGTVTSGGAFTAPSSAQTDTVQAASGGVSGTATVYVTAASGPVVVLAAAASPSPVTGTTTTLSVLGSDAGGESGLLYTWSCTGPAGVTYSANGTNTAKNTTVTFTQAGTYVFTVTISDGVNPSVTSSVTVTVDQTASYVSVSPINVQLSDGATQQFTASDVDQFGNAMPTQPSSFTWAVTDGTGTVTQAGLYTAPEPTAYSVAVNETDLVQASDGSLSGVAEVGVSGLPGTPPGQFAPPPPSPPTGLAAMAGDHQVTLTWTDSDPTITEYLIYRSYSPGGEGPGPVASVGGGSGTGITYTDTGLTDRQIYYYTVTAVYGGEESAYSNEASATPFNVPPTITTPASATPITVTGTTTTLNIGTISGDQPPSPITIVWKVKGPAPVTISTSGTGGSTITTATFTAAGTYTFTVYATDADGATTSSTVTVVVQQTLTAITVQTPSPSAPIAGGGSYFFQTGGTDQFGNPMGAGGATYTVTSGSGTVSASSDPPGVEFHAPGGASPETDTITMTDGGFTKTITVSVTPSLTGGHWGTTQDPAQDQPTVTPMGTVTITDPADGIFGASVPFVPTEYEAKGVSGQSASVSISGASLAFQFFWVPDFPGGTAPPMTYFRVSGTAVSEGYYPDSGPAGSASASDGLGDAEQDSDGTFGDGTVSVSAGSSGTHLMPEDTHSGTASFSVQDISAAATGAALAIAEVGVGATPVSAPDVSVSSPSNGAIVPAGSDVMLKVHADPTFVYDPSNPINPLQSLSVQVTGGGGGGGSLTPDANGNASLDLGSLPAGMYTATVEATYQNGSGTVTVNSMPTTFYVASFTVKTNSWNPNPAYVSQIVTGQVQGSLDPSSLDGGGSGPFFVTYTWTTAGVWYSQDGTAGSFEPCTSYAIGWTQGQASTTFNAQFFTPGQYLLEVSCVATVYSQSTGAAVAVFTQTGYIGGDASDIDASGGGQAGHAQKAHGRIAHAGGGGGITVLAATVTFDTTSVKLGLGSPQKYYAIIGATVTPAYQIGSVSFQALDPFGLPSDEVTVKVASQDLLSGALTLLITATGPTPATTGGSPDCTIAATVPSFAGSQTVASATALVLQPTYCSEANPPSPKETNKHWLPTIQPDPTWHEPSNNVAGHTQYDTTVVTDVQITIYDQYHNPLDSMYDGNNLVIEDITGSLTRHGPITYPSTALSSGMIQDEVRDSDYVNYQDQPDWDMNWDTYNQLLNGFDNAISIKLGVSSLTETLNQVLSISGYTLSPTWIRKYTIYQRNHADGPPMGSVTETAMSGT